MTLHKITTPVAGFTGESVGVSFRDGVGHTDNPAALAYFRSQGYGVEAPTPAAGEQDESALPKKSASAEAWRTYAVEHGDLLPDEAAAMTRDQLVERFTTTKEDGQ